MKRYINLEDFDLPQVSEPLVASYNPRYKGNPLIDLSFELASDIWDFNEFLVSLRKFEVASQIFRSGTAVGAISREAQNAESRADFKHKLKMALKEADETEFWLLLCQHKGVKGATKILAKLIPVAKILNKILSTLSKNSSKENAK